MSRTGSRPPRRNLRQFLPAPKWAGQLSAWIGSRLPVNPVVLAAIKLIVVTPLIILALAQVAVLPNSRAFVSMLFVGFFVLDYLEAAVARDRDMEPRSARVFDRFTDYPLLFTVGYFASGVVPVGLLAAKLALDVLLLLLFVLGYGSTENRLRTGISYASVVALLFVGQGWAPRVLNPQAVEYLLWANIAFSATTAAYFLGLLQKRFVADTLSAANLMCGVFSMMFAARGRFEMSLLFVILGTAFDGFDGAAARRWGGTRFGVYSDDIADGVNYGIAPGAALYFLFGGLSGAVVGIFYAVFTLARLVFFTLNKADSDPNYFAGVPSPVGGLITMSSIVVFRGEPAIIGLIVGIACTQMVSFSTHYRHLGRALARHRRALVGAPVYLVALLLSLRLWGARGGGAVILIGNLIYGFLPTFLAFRAVVSDHRARRRARREDTGANASVDIDDDDVPCQPDDALPQLPFEVESRPSDVPVPSSEAAVDKRKDELIPQSAAAGSNPR